MSSAPTTFTGTRKNIEHLLDHKHFELMRHDVTFPLYVEVDDLYLACPASPIHYQRDPVQTTKTSVHGAINMLGLAKRVKAKFSRHPLPKSMAILMSIRSPRNIGVTSIRSALDPVMTKANAAPRHYF